MDIIQFVKDLFMLKFLPQLGSDAGLGLLFIVGVLTSFHCVAMCGGIILSQTSMKKNDAALEDGAGKRVWLKPSLMYNSGRVMAYTLVGGVAGGIGQAVSLTGIWKGLIPMIGGLFMIIMGINLLGIFPALRRFNLRMPYFAMKKIKSGSSKSPLYIGLLTGLMPCGPLQIVQLYALGTGSVLRGAASMLIFSLGTVPLLFTFGALNTLMNKKFAHRMIKVSAVFVIMLGFVMAGRGLALSGMHVTMPSASAWNVTTVAEGGIAVVSGNLQNVETSIKSDSYPPITVKKGVPVKWIIKADADNLNTCNNAIVLPEYKIEKKLLAGDNLVEFIPEKEGEFIYTCWMGMIKSKIYVVSDLSTVVPKQQPKDASFDAGKPETCAAGMMGQSNNGEAACMDSSVSASEPPPIIAQTEAIVLSASPDTVETTAESKTLQESENGLEQAAASEPVPTVKPEEEQTTAAKSPTELKGFLIDKHCFDQMRPFDQITPQEDTLSCLTMEECAASGYGIAVKESDGTYVFYLFDPEGQKTAATYLAGTTKNSDFGITVKGIVTDENILIKTFKEIANE